MTTGYEKYQVKQVINASGKMTILGGSKVAAEVSEACREGAANFFEIHDLLEKTGSYLANRLGVEDTYIVSSASSGIAQCVAASICGNDLERILHVQDPRITKKEIVMAKGHNVDYGTSIEVPISMGGGIVVEAGYANTCKREHIEAKINEHTAALLYVKSHHCVQKSMISIEEMVEVKKKYQLPLIIDAAAEEDLTYYYNLGADAIIYSGTKALEGPTSGFIVGRTAFLAKVKEQSKGIGRVMKVGKENICGLACAIERYIDKSHISLDAQMERLKPFHDRIEGLPHVSAKAVQDGAGRAIMRSELTFDEQALAQSAKDIAKQLKEGNPAIYTRDYRANAGVIEIDIRDVSDAELGIIYDRLGTVLKGK